MKLYNNERMYTVQLCHSCANLKIFRLISSFVKSKDANNKEINLVLQKNTQETNTYFLIQTKLDLSTKVCGSIR